MLLQEFYNFKFEKEKDLHTNVSLLKNITVALQSMKENITESIVISKLLTVLPEEYKHFSSAWDSTPEENKTLKNLISRLAIEEDNYKMNIQEETAVSYKA
jgi:hypothetical protein